MIFQRGSGPPATLWIRTWCSHHSFMVKATIHYLIWAWQTLIDRRMYHPFIVIYLIISVYYRNLRCFNRWQLYILFNNVSYFGWSLTNHWPRALFPIKHDCRRLNCRLTSMNVDRKSLEFSICRQSGKQTAIQKVCFWRYLIYFRR